MLMAINIILRGENCERVGREGWWEGDWEGGRGGLGYC